DLARVEAGDEGRPFGWPHTFGETGDAVALALADQLPGLLEESVGGHGRHSEASGIGRSEALRRRGEAGASLAGERGRRVDGIVASARVPRPVALRCPLAPRIGAPDACRSPACGYARHVKPPRMGQPRHLAALRAVAVLAIAPARPPLAD